MLKNYFDRFLQSGSCAIYGKLYDALGGIEVLEKTSGIKHSDEDIQGALHAVAKRWKKQHGSKEHRILLNP